MTDMKTNTFVEGQIKVFKQLLTNPENIIRWSNRKENYPQKEICTCTNYEVISEKDSAQIFQVFRINDGEKYMLTIKGENFKTSEKGLRELYELADRIFEKEIRRF